MSYVDWSTAKSIGKRLSGDGPEVSMIEAAEIVEELRDAAARAHGPVAETARLDTSGRPAAPVVVVDRKTWIDVNLDSFEALTEPVFDKLLAKRHINDPIFDIAKQLEEVALHDEYFIERKLYPNVDFYSGVIYRAIGITVPMFTVLFAIGRLPGWIAHWLEMHRSPNKRICRPRQIYTGPAERDFVPIDKRG